MKKQVGLFDFGTKWVEPSPITYIFTSAALYLLGVHESRYSSSPLPFVKWLQKKPPLKTLFSKKFSCFFLLYSLYGSLDFELILIKLQTMESQTDGNNDMKAIKEVRQQLESRVDTLTNAQVDLISSLHDIVPDLVSTLDLSLKVISSFNGRPFSPLPKWIPNLKPKDVRIPKLPLTDGKITSNNLKSSTVSKSDNERLVIDERGGPLSVVRSMVAVCLLERVPFTPIDSSTVLRKLENDESATAAEKAALRELGGESGAILAVEMALRSMAEDNGGVDLEEFVVSGKSRVMVMNIDRTRLLKELPESKQLYQQSEINLDEKNRGIDGAKTGVDLSNSSGFGMGRPMHDMWMQGPGMPPMFPGGMGPRMNGPRGMMGMMGMPRGVGVPPPMQRPPMGPNVPMGGPNVIPLKPRTEEEDMKDLEALLNKKSFKELQKSKTGEELLDLIHRPTAKETAVAAKVLNSQLVIVMMFCYE